MYVRRVLYDVSNKLFKKKRTMKIPNFWKILIFEY